MEDKGAEDALLHVYYVKGWGVLFCGWATVSLVALETCGYRTSSVSFGDGKGTVKSSNGEILYESKVVSQKLAICDALFKLGCGLGK